MGRFSEMQIEMQEQADELEFDWQAEQQRDEQEMAQELDFDARNYTDGAYWADLEAEQMEAERMQQIESLAEIVENRVNGYGE
jgi:hypothetical protein